MERVIRHLMRLEGCTHSEAKEILDDILFEVNDAISCGDYELAEDIWMSDTGLDIDDMMEVLI